MKNTNVNVGKMVRLAILIAIILVMSFTPLGYLRTLGIEITFIMIPVAIASIIVGPVGGAIAGCVFGITSFIQCFGASPFGAMLMSINPILTFIMCLVPRIIAGWLPGLIYLAIIKLGKSKTAAAIAASVSASVLNTVLFIVSLYLLFGNTDFIRSFGDSIWDGFVALVGVNGLVEVTVGTVAGAAASRALVYFFPGKKPDARMEKKAGKKSM